MGIFVTAQVTCKLLQYYRALLKNPKYKISAKRAKTKYLNFWQYVSHGIQSNLEKGVPCMYKQMGQKFNKKGEPRIPSLKVIEYYDESRTKWYIAYLFDETTGDITVTKIQQASLVKCSRKKQNNTISETMLRRIIYESLKELLR